MFCVLFRILLFLGTYDNHKMALILLGVGECCSKKYVFSKNEEASWRVAHGVSKQQKWNLGTREPKNIEKTP
jgi:hypothetical protein